MELKKFFRTASAINITLLWSEDDMVENSPNEKSNISKVRTQEEIADYWDSHSLADHWDQTHEVEFDVRAQRPRRIAIDQN